MYQGPDLGDHIADYRPAYVHFYIQLQNTWKWKWRDIQHGDPYSEFVLCIYPILSAHLEYYIFGTQPVHHHHGYDTTNHFVDLFEQYI